MAEQKQPSKEQLKLQQQINELYKKGKIEISDFTSMMSDANKMSQAQIANATKHLDTLKKITKEKAKESAYAKEIEDLQDKQLDIVGDLSKGIKGNLENFKTIGDKNKDISKQLREHYKQQFALKNMTKKTLDDKVKELNENEKLADVMQKIANSGVGAIYQDAQEQAANAVNKIESLFTSVPGGGALFRYLGGEKLAKNMDDAVNAGFTAMASSLKDGGSQTQSLQAGMQAFSKTVGAIPNIGMVLGIGAAIALGAALFGIFQDISGAAKELSKETGITYTEAKKLNAEARKAQQSFDNQLATMEDITAVQSELVQSMGSAALVSTEVAANVADTAKAFGVSAETAGKVTSELTQMGMSQQEAADLQLETNAMALKAGVNVAAVQEDIAANAKTAAKYFGGSGKELAKAAVEAAKMGVSIEQMVKTADGLLDIESSLEKQFRAQALTGKNLNFEKARQLALDGKIEEAQAEMLRQAGSIEDFNAMAPHQRKALAEAMGMEVGELQKSLQLQKMRGKLSADELAAANGLNLSAEQLANMSAKDIKNELAKKNAADKTAAAFDSIKNTLIQALAPAAEAFAGIFAGLAPIIKGLGFVLKVAFLPITLAGKAMQKLQESSAVVKAIVYGIGTALAFNYAQTKGMTAEGTKQKINAAADYVRQGAINALKAVGLITDQSKTAEQKVSLGLYAKQKAGIIANNVKKGAGLALETSKNVLLGIGNMLLGKERMARMGNFLIGVKDNALAFLKNTYQMIFNKEKRAELLNTIKTYAIKLKEFLMLPSGVALKKISNALGLKEKLNAIKTSAIKAKDFVMEKGRNAIAGAYNLLLKVRQGMSGKGLATRIKDFAIMVKEKGMMIATNALQVTKNILAGAYNTFLAIREGIQSGEYAQKLLTFGLMVKEKATALATNVILGAKNLLVGAYNTLLGIGAAIQSKGIGGILKEAGAFLMKAVSGIFATLSQIPFGAGLLLAGGAVAGLFALFNKAKSEKAGDVGIAPKGGPIVASPKEGRIFQGTNNDGVEMSPTAGDPGSGGGGGTTATISSDQMKQIIEALQQIVAGVQNPPPVVIGEGEVSSIGSKISAAKSFIS